MPTLLQESQADNADTHSLEDNGLDALDGDAEDAAFEGEIDDFEMADYDWQLQEDGSGDSMFAEARLVDSEAPSDHADDHPEDDNSRSEDEGGQENEDPNRTEYFRGAAKTYGRGQHLFEKIESSDAYRDIRKTFPHFPFSCDMDWEMANTLDSLPISMNELDSLLKTDYVCPFALSSAVLF